MFLSLVELKMFLLSKLSMKNGIFVINFVHVKQFSSPKNFRKLEKRTPGYKQIDTAFPESKGLVEYYTNVYVS